MQFGDEVPGTVRRVQGAHLRDAAQRLHGGERLLAGDLDHHDGADAAIVVVLPHPQGEAQNGAAVEKPVDPPPDKQPETSPTPKSHSVREAVKPLVDLGPRTDLGAEVKPFVPDPLPYDPGPPARPADPPAPPPLVLAKLDPRYAAGFQPDYPASEQRREVEGAVRVRVLIGTDGRVKAVELVSTDSPGFFEETKRRALAKWRFKPATRGGVPEESWQVMTVRFEIKGA